jgi:multicomponent Na+:H+ antiporter subunit D
MWMTDLPAFVPFFIAALLALITRGWLRNLIMLATPVLGGLQLWLEVTPGILTTVPILEYELMLMRVDRLSLLFGYIFHIAAFIAAIFALRVRDTTQTVSSLLYAGSAIGAVFAGDLITLFIFWELLALSSVFLIWARRTECAIRSGLRYLVIQVSSGMLLLAGAMVHYYQTGSLTFDFIGLEGVGGWLIFLAFGIKCAFPLLHNWLTDAYPEATPTGAVFLSVFTTKVAVYALARGFPGTELLVYIGAVMTCFPIFYAVIENDLRRVLAYSMINQLGFMVCGIGIGTALALNGTVAHAFSHILYKALLFMSMGAVLYRAGSVKGTDLGGLYKSMPKTASLCIIGACSISAFPLFSGFVSKSMVMAAMIEEGYDYLWLVLLFASAGVFHHAGIKIPYFAFFAHDSGIRTREAPLNMLIAMSIAAMLCVFIGTQPQYLYALLPWEVEYWPYDTTHVLSQFQLLFFAALAFVWLNKLGIYPREMHAVNLDADWLYRKLIPDTVRSVYRYLKKTGNSIEDTFDSTLKDALKTMISTRFGRFHLAASWPTGSMVFWIAIILGVFLLADVITSILPVSPQQ